MSFRQTEPLVIAAAKAGFSPASAYRIEQDPRLPSQKQAPRERRPRDPVSAVCDSEVVPLLKSVAGLRPVASSTRSVGGIPRSVPASAARCNVASARGGPSTAPSRTSSSVRSTRRAAGVVRFYRHGDQGVSIAGAPLDHRLYHFRLAFSGWEHAQIVLGGESFVALTEGCRMHCGRSVALPCSTAATACRPSSAISTTMRGRIRPAATRRCARITV